MASEIRVDRITHTAGVGTITPSPTGVHIAGIVTGTTFSGSGASLTSLPAAQVTGTLPAISGANLTNLAAANLTGTIADARIPATLPAASAANLTSIPAANVTGTLPALTAANLTNIPAANIVGVCTSGLTKTGGFGKFASYAIIADQKATDTAGGSSSTGTFNTRDLNTELADPDGIVTISSNQFTLQAGSYLIRASAPAYKAARHQILINNVTDSAVAAVGQPEYCSASAGVGNRAFAAGRVTITGAKAFDIRHRVGNAETTYGLGVEANYDLQPNIYTIVEIFKEA